MPPPVPMSRSRDDSTATAPDLPTLEFFNGLGGFTADGDEYVTILARRSVHTRALDQCDCQSGVWLSGIDRRQRLHLVRQQPRKPAHALVQRSGRRPFRGSALRSRRRHRQALRADGTAASPRHRQSMWHAMDAATAASSTRVMASHSTCCSSCRLTNPIKVSRLRIRNLSGRTRRLTLTAYVEWVLGTSRSATAPYVATEMDTVTGGMFARNLRSGADAGVAFTDLGGHQTSLDRQPHGIHRAQWFARKTRRARQERGALRPHRRRSGPLRCVTDVPGAGRERLHRTRVAAG